MSLLKRLIGRLFPSLVLAMTAITAVVITPEILRGNPSKSPQEAGKIAQQFTVKIKGFNTINKQEGHGSGFIIAKNGNLYTVLTNWHVVRNPDEYSVKTVDDNSYTIELEKQRIGELDLALVYFTSDRTYEIATKGDFTQLTIGQDLYLSGYPFGADAFYFYSAPISNLLPKPDLEAGKCKGIQLSLARMAPPGMSGSPIVNEQGEVFGVYCGRKPGLDETYALSLDSINQFANPPIPWRFLPCKNISDSRVGELVSLGDRERKAKKFNAAYTYYQEANRLDANCYEAWFSLGITHLTLDARDDAKERAIEAFDRAISLKPNAYEAFCYRGITSLFLGKKEEAINSYNRAIQIQPTAASQNPKCKTLSDEIRKG